MKKNSIIGLFLVGMLLAACSSIPGLEDLGGQTDQFIADMPPPDELGIAATEVAVAGVQSTQAPASEPTLVPTITPTLFVDPETRQLLSFDEGGTRAEVFGAVEAFGVMEYLIPAGQIRRIEVSLRSADDSLALAMLSEGGLEISGDIEEQLFWRGQLPSSTNSVLRVVGGTERVIFSILVEVPQLIQLPDGTLFESLQGAVSPEDRDAEYMLQPVEGETLTLKVTAPNNDVLLSATGIQDGQLYLGIPAEFGGYALDLSDTQDYLVAVLGIGGETPFTLDVSVKVPEPEGETASGDGGGDGTPEPVYPLLLATVNGKAVPRFWQNRNGSFSFNAVCGYIDTIPKQDPEGRIKLPDGLNIWVVEDGSFTFGECLVDISNGIFKGDGGKQWVIIADNAENRANELLKGLIGLPLRRADLIFSQ